MLHLPPALSGTILQRVQPSLSPRQDVLLRALTPSEQRCLTALPTHGLLRGAVGVQGRGRGLAVQVLAAERDVMHTLKRRCLEG